MDLESIKAYNEEQKRKADEQSAIERQKDNADNISNTVASTNGAVAGMINQSASKTQQATKEVGKAVETAGQDIINAMASSQNEVATALNNLVIATVVSKDPQLIQASKDVADLLSSISQAGADFKGSNLNLLPVANEKLAQSIDTLASSMQETPDIDYTKQLDSILKQLKALDLKPVVNIPEDKEVDFTPLIDAVNQVKQAVKDSAIELPENDDTEVIDTLRAVKNSIDNLVFPVPNYVLPFKDNTGKATQLMLDANGAIPAYNPSRLLTKPYDRLIITYTDTTKTTISTIVSKLAGATQDTITNTPSGTVDDLVRT